MLRTVRHLLIGQPFPSSWAQIKRLAIPLAFVIISSDALSSVAYASEEILIQFTKGGVQGSHFVLLVALAIAALAVVVVLSYEQVVRAYPGGGGAYAVASQNLGVPLGLAAAAGLLVDYVLTVSVSVTAAVASVASAFSVIADHKVGFSILLVVLLTIINLRGVRESALAFAMPVYLFIGSVAVMAGVGVLRYITEGRPAVPIAAPPALGLAQGMGFLVLLRAFSAGCVALTGLEAVSNTIGIFKPPAAKNARITLAFLGVTLGAMFLAVTLLAFLFNIEQGVGERETLMAKVAQASFGTNGFYYVVLLSTTAILFVAANTSFSSFPRLASILAHDGYLPRPIANLGDRLVYSNGVLLLAALSVGLIVVFQGNTHFLLPLYAIGVFLDFTLTQAGMVVHWWKNHEPGWLRALVANGAGGVVTLIVLLVFVLTKFTSGAWVVVLVIPLGLLAFTAVSRHYRTVAEALSLERRPSLPQVAASVVILPIGGVHRAVLPALEYAKAIGSGSVVRAVHVSADEDAARTVQARWNRLQTDIPLTVIPSPYRAVVGPLVDYIRTMTRQHPNGYVTVVIPEFVPRQWWQHLLHNQTATMLKMALLFERRVIVVDVPFHLEK